MSEYTRTSPSLTQRVVLLFMRKRAAEIEASTKEWIITCPNCGLERTLPRARRARDGAPDRHARARGQTP